MPVRWLLSNTGGGCYDRPGQKHWPCPRTREGGELAGFCDDDQWIAAPGSFVFVPRDRPHGFTVTSSGPARALVITGPSRLDRQIAAHARAARR